MHPYMVVTSNDLPARRRPGRHCHLVQWLAPSPSTARGPHVTTSDERRWQVLEKVYDGTGPTVDFVGIIGHQPDEHESQHWRHTLRALDREGLINYHSRIDGGGSAEITDPGRAKVEERRRLRV